MHSSCGILNDNRSLHTSGLLQWRCGAQASPWGKRAQGSWGDAASSRCLTAMSSLCVSSLGDALPQHPQPTLNPARHQKAFLIPSLQHFYCKRSLLPDVLPILTFSFQQHDIETCWTSGPVLILLYSSLPFLQNRCRLLLILCALIIPAQVWCLALVSNSIPFLSSQTIFAICWTHLNSHPVTQYICSPS